MACTGILLGEMLPEAWPNNLLTMVCATLQTFSHTGLSHPCTEILTPVDQPLDKLDDLKPDEMCALALNNNNIRFLSVIIFSVTT